MAVRAQVVEDEAKGAERFRFAEDRDRFIVASGVLRTILGRYFNVQPERVWFCYGAQGKPALSTRFAEHGIHLNVSHSHHIALYAVARNRQVGIDLEYIRRMLEVGDIVKRCYSSYERAVLRAPAPGVRLGAFFGGWTCEEAHVKGTGHGFRLAPDRFDVAIAPGEPARFSNISVDPAEAGRWGLRELLPAPGYFAAPAAERQGWHLCC